jgi:DNA-binding MarR family transcriptional regulator
MFRQLHPLLLTSKNSTLPARTMEYFPSYLKLPAKLVAESMSDFKNCRPACAVACTDIIQYRRISPDMDNDILGGAKKIRHEKDMPDEERPTRRVSQCNAGAAKRAARRLSLMYDTVLAPSGLKVSQYGILSALNARGVALPTVQELAEELIMDRSTLGQNLRPLARDELITLLTDPKDRRVRLIALTKLGLARLNEAAKYWRIAQDRFEANFGQQEAADLRSVLLGIAHNPKFGKQK